MKFSYTRLKECTSFWTWLWWTWEYPNLKKPYPENFHCWRFCGITKDIEMSDFGEEHWDNIKENKYPGSYKLVKSKLENEGKFWLI